MLKCQIWKEFKIDLLLRKVIEKSIKDCKYRDIEFIVDLENNIFLYFNKRIFKQIFRGHFAPMLLKIHLMRDKLK